MYTNTKFSWQLKKVSNSTLTLPKLEFYTTHSSMETFVLESEWLICNLLCKFIQQLQSKIKLSGKVTFPLLSTVFCVTVYINWLWRELQTILNWLNYLASDIGRVSGIKTLCMLWAVKDTLWRGIYCNNFQTYLLKYINIYNSFSFKCLSFHVKYSCIIMRVMLK